MAQTGTDRLLRWPSLPIKLYTLLMESLLFHASCVGIFSALLLPVAQLWQQIKGLEVLEVLNPLGPRRIPGSPLLSGQYLGFDLALRLCSTHRILRGQSAPSHVLHAFRNEIATFETSLAETLGKHCQQNPADQTHGTLLQLFSIMLGSLRICSLGLDLERANAQFEIDSMVSDTLAKFLVLQLLDMPQTGLVWAIQILACAVRPMAEFDALSSQFRQLMNFMDAGAQGRNRQLMARLQTIKTHCYGMHDATGQQPDSLMHGLLLLHRKAGILG